MTTIIEDQLYLGDFLDANDVNLSEKIDRAIAVCNEFGVKHHCEDSWQLGFPDKMNVDIGTIHRVVQRIHEGLSDRKRVLVHCVAGISRSPMIVACYLVKSGRQPIFDAALNYIAERRPQVDPARDIYNSGRSYCASGLALNYPQTRVSKTLDNGLKAC